MTAVIFLCVLAILWCGWLFVGWRQYRKLEKKAQLLENENRLLAWFDHRIPVGSRFYFDRPTGRGCARCGSGSVWRRYRYQLVGYDEGGTTVQELTGLYWCSDCRYRGLSLRKFT